MEEQRVFRQPGPCLITPRPVINSLLDHGVLAPHARGRSRVVCYGRPAPDANAGELEARPGAAGTLGAWTWATLMRRVFALDVLAGPAVAAGWRVIATLQDPAIVPTILAHLGRAHSTERPGPAPPAPAAIT
jgi:hypothetical protein